MIVQCKVKGLENDTPLVVLAGTCAEATCGAGWRLPGERIAEWLANERLVAVELFHKAIRLIEISAHALKAEMVLGGLARGT